jgi:hypothetical protein
MTWDEYFQFLDEYWELFGEPPARPVPVEYSNVRF